MEYYTRTVFEVQPEGGGAQSTLGGGGRYDDLIEQLGGKPAPAVGFATGIERVILTMRQQDIAPPSAPGPKVYLAYLGEEAKKEAIKLAAALRRAGLGAALAVGDKSLKAQMKQANVSGADWAIIVGEEEMKRGTVVLRDMLRGEQREICSEDVRAMLSNNIYKVLDRAEEP